MARYVESLKKELRCFLTRKQRSFLCFRFWEPQGVAGGKGSIGGLQEGTVKNYAQIGLQTLAG